MKYYYIIHIIFFILLFYYIILIDNVDGQKPDLADLFDVCDPFVTGPNQNNTCLAGLECTRVADNNGSLTNNGSCTVCGKGNFCPPGTSSLDGQWCRHPCPAKYYCPSPLIKVPCPAGHVCPLGTPNPTRCTESGMYCGPMSEARSVCSEGYYCPTTSKQILCKEGTFCLAGSNRPRDCPLLASCPEGSRLPTFSYLSVIVLGIVFFGFGLALYFEQKFRIEQQRRHTRSLNQQIEIETAKKALHRLFNDSEYDTQFTGFTKVDFPIRLRFENISLQLPNGRVIIKDINGVFRCGSVNAIMGVSGCGKTSFLNALTNKAYYAIPSGSIYINSHKMDPSALKDVIAFVPQDDDSIHGDLSVRHNIEYSAKLRLPKGKTDAEVAGIVNDTIRLLGLESTEHTIVGTTNKRGVSGGQKKRVNIGVELVTCPKILFLDEPTSGLDASSSIEIVRSLKSLATLGVTVVMVIHQPRWNLFQLFDNILLLGKGGEEVFNGTPSQAVKYFEDIGFEKNVTDNPADWLMDCISGIIKNIKETDFDYLQLPLYWRAKVKSFSRSERRSRGLSSSMRKRSKSKSMDEYKTNLSPVHEVKIELAERNLNSSNVTSSNLNKSVDYSIEENNGETETNQLDNDNIDNKEEESDDSDVVDNDDSDDEFTEPKTFGGLVPREMKAIREQLAQLMEKSVDEIVTVEDLYRLFTILKVDSSVESADALLSQLQQKVGGKVQVKDIPHIVFSNQFVETFRTSHIRFGIAQIKRQKSSYESAADVQITALTRDKPSFFIQFQLFCTRALLKMRARAFNIALDLMIMTLSGAVVGLAYGTDWNLSQLPLLHMMNCMFVGTLSVVGTLPVFGSDRLQFYRESAAGINRLAYGLAQIITDCPLIFLRAILYSAISYSLTSPMQEFWEYFVTCLLMSFWGSSFAYCLSISLNSTPTTIVGVVVPVTFGGLLSGVQPTLSVLKSNFVGTFLGGLSYARWALELLVIEDIKDWPVNINGEIEFVLTRYGFDTDVYLFNLIILLIQGLGYCILAILALFFLYRSKQK